MSFVVIVTTVLAALVVMTTVVMMVKALKAKAVEVEVPAERSRRAYRR